MSNLLLDDNLTELQQNGYTVLPNHFTRSDIDSCRDAFWPVLMAYLKEHKDEPNRGPRRHFLPMPFQPPCFCPGFFFDEKVLAIVTQTLGDRVVADQWGCDVPLRGSDYQQVHADYQRPLFHEIPECIFPPYMLVISFCLAPIGLADGPIELAPGTHCMARSEAQQAVNEGKIKLTPITLEPGDVLIRHPWALHRGTPNTTDSPRALVTIRYTRHWYWDGSRDVNTIPRDVWMSLTADQQKLMRFPFEGSA